MKIQRIVITILTALAIVCACIAIFSRYYMPVPGEEVAAAFLKRHQSNLSAFVEEVEERLIWPCDVTSVGGRDSESGCVRFRLRGFVPPSEGSMSLLFIPSDNYSHPFMDEDIWSVKESSTDRWHWIGGGINGQGYIIAVRLQPCWFYVEEYLPT